MNRLTQYLDRTNVWPIEATEDVEHRFYDSHGNVVANEPTTLFAFDGRHFDPATAAQFNFNRHFDPTVGQWMSEDRIGFADDDENLHRYVGE